MYPAHTNFPFFQGTEHNCPHKPLLKFLSIYIREFFCRAFEHIPLKQEQSLAESIIFCML